jgi:polyhydroxyalkanoate synthesis regulator phasin
VANVEIGEVATEMVIQESVGTLSPEEVKRLVKLVLEQLKNHQENAAQRERDTKITNSAYHGRD